MVPMFGKLIIFAILGVLLYALFIKMKTRITGAPPPAPQQIVKSGEKSWLGNDVRISKIQIIISALAALYLIWAIITLYR
jgi:hypothetical protein